MTVSAQTPYAATVANGATTVFSFGFMVADEVDLEVSVDGIVQPGSAYAVSGVGAAGGGDVEFVAAPANGSKVLIALKPVFERQTDYAQLGDLHAAVLNLDFDRLWLALQSLAQQTRRALKLPFDTPADQEIAADAATRANRGLRFDPAGNLELSQHDPDAAQAAGAAAIAAAETAVTAAAQIDGFENRGAWVAASSYQTNNLVRVSGSTYIALVDHVSDASFAVDLGAARWEIFAQAGATGAGSGDVLVANNLSEFTATAATARANLQLGTASLKNTGTGSGDIPTNADVRGKQTIAIPAGALRPRANDGCAALDVVAGAADQPDMPYLAFAGHANQYAGIVIAMPKSWNLGTLTASFQWARAAGTAASNVVWGMRARAFNDNDSRAAAFGAEATVTDDAKAAAANFALSGETAACTVGGTPLAGSLVFLEFFRKGIDAADTLADAAQLASVRLHYTTNANTDA